MKRYRLLFIDDEEVIRESFLKLVDWNRYHFDVAGVFKNGEDAWEHVEKSSVDIIVTDINMPFMDGIDLLERIRRKQLHTRVIFLTGYEYFEYAQKAVQMKAFDFLLKPITKEKLLKAVQSAAFDIEKEEAVQEAAGKGLEISREIFFNQVLYGKLESLEQEAAELGISTKPGSYLLMMAAVDVKKGQKITDDELERWKNAWKSKIRRCKERYERMVASPFQMYFAKDISQHMRIVFVSEERNQFSESFIRDFADLVLGLEETESHYRVTLIAGRCRRRLEELKESLERVEYAAEHRHILSGKNWRLMYASDYTMERVSEETIVLPTDTLLHHIRMGMVQEVQNDIKKIYEPFHRREYISLSSAKMITTELAIVAFKGEITTNDESVSYLYYLNHIQQLNTLEELENDITQFAVRVASQRKAGVNPKRKTAESALEYLKQNYQREELSLNDVAEYLNISVPYLAVLFKQETGQSFGTHLLEIRMKRAEELLRTTGYTVAEIAEQVGYSSAQYFAVRFKKFTGMSPGVYREQL